MRNLGKLVYTGTALFFLSTTPVFAEAFDLITLYKSATEYDTQIASAKSAYLAQQQDESIAMSGLLPNLSASATKGLSDSDTKVGAPPASDSTKSMVYALNLSQPIFNLSSWHDLSASEYNSARAEATYLAAQQDLILNVATAYFNVLRAEENLTAARALETAVKRQYEQAKEQFDVGLIAITDVHEAKASFDSSKTSRIRAEGELTIAHESLARITGEYAHELYTLGNNYPINVDPNNTTESWMNAAQENNLNVKAAEFALKSLEADHSSKKAGHYPTLTLTANYENSEFENRNGPSAPILEQNNSGVFLNLNVPLYSGGVTQAQVRKSRYLLEQARHDLSTALRSAKIESRTEFINIRTNVQTVESLSQNIVSRESALEATREGYNVGTRNIVEVLDAERNYFTALRDYASARFDFVISTLKIKRAAGLLHEKDLTNLNAYLERRTK